MAPPKTKAVAKANAPVVAAAPATQAGRAASVVMQSEYSGSIPPPDLLRGFDDLVPGSAARIIAWAEDEQRHRHRMESGAQSANIDAQRRQIDLQSAQARAIFRSDMVGQVFGLVVCLSCIGGAVLLGLSGHPWVAGALCAIPTGAVIYAFRGHLFATQGKDRAK
jgi:uncharacterized membrane protein